MKAATLHSDHLPADAIFVTCVTEEDRCVGMVQYLNNWSPASAIVCTYAGSNPRRDEHLRTVRDALQDRSIGVTVVECEEGNPAVSLRQLGGALSWLHETQERRLVLDMSVFTKRHLLMLWRWFDDRTLWNRVCITYSEPGDYLVSEFVPLSFGLESLQQIPGFPGCADCSRPIHLVLFLGYEGDRALAVYEQIQPMDTTLIIPSPPFRPSWEGRTEKMNRDLLAVVGSEAVQTVDAIDPTATVRKLQEVLGNGSPRSAHASIICPLGTKPQTLGVFEFLRQTNDPAAVVYARPLRHNHSFYSSGIGPSWVVKNAV